MVTASPVPGRCTEKLGAAMALEMLTQIVIGLRS
jgi:hypothetical protein